MSHSQNYTDNILNAIDIIVNQSISHAKFDQTITATVIECTNEVKGEYKVKYQDAYYYVTSEAADKVYAKGTQVYVLIPGNDFSKKKKILGSVSDLGVSYQTPSLSEQFDVIGSDSCVMLREAELSYLAGRDNREVLYNVNVPQDQNKLDIDVDSLSEYMKQAKHFRIEASFKTDIPWAQQLGNYGIAVLIKFIDSVTQEEGVKEFTFMSSDMEGIPYTFSNYSKQSFYFEFEGEDFERIEQIVFFAEDFPKPDSKQEKNIWVKDIRIVAVEKNSVTYQDPYVLTVLAPKGLIFRDNIDSLILEASVAMNGKAVPESDLKFYWFIEDRSVTSSSMYYSSLAGLGWKGITGYNTIVKDDRTSIEWLPGESKYELESERIQAESAKIKCIALYEDTNIFSKEINISKRNASYKVFIESSNGTDFAQDLGSTNLTCKVESDEVLNNLTYYWTRQSSAGTVIALNDNIEKTPIVEELTNKEFLDKSEQLKTNLQNQIKLTGNQPVNDDSIKNLYTAMETLTLSAETVTKLLWDFYRFGENVYYQVLLNNITNYLANNKIPYKEGNTLYNILAKSINSFNIYNCTVYNGETLLGSAEITINNRILKEVSATIVLENGNQVFKYSAGGMSPAHTSFPNPQKIKALTFKIYNSNGEVLSTENVKNTPYYWYVPIDKTLIKLADSTNAEEVNGYYKIGGKESLVFGIQDKYNSNYTNNDIRLEINLQGEILQTITNFSFIKDGEPGTNGTEFFCRITPNSKDTLEGYPTLNYYPGLNILNWNFDLAEKTKWFNAELMKNGDLVDIDGGNIYWKFLKNNIDHDSYSFFKLNGTTEDYNGFKDTGLQFELDGTAVYNHVNDKNLKVPSNILQSLVKYNNKNYYGTMPISIAVLTQSTYQIQMKPNTGYNYVVYSSNGYYPQYADSDFEIEILKGGKPLSEEEKQTLGLKYTWEVIGSDTGIAKDDGSSYPQLSSKDTDIYSYVRHFEPFESYNGEAVDIALKCQVSEIGTLFFPIYFTLNKYEHEATNKWNGNSINLNEEDGIILSPQVITGKKNDNDNTFTGLVMGEAKFHSYNEALEKTEVINQIGLLGYNQGLQTLFLNAETGEATFGANKEVQFLFPKSALDIDPDTGEVIGGGETQPEIKLGPWNLTQTAIYKGSDYLGGDAQEYLDDLKKNNQTADETDSAYAEKIISSRNQMYLGDLGFSLGHNLIYTAGDPDGDKDSSLVIRGRVESEEGKIGPWYIDTDSLSFGKNDKFFKDETDVYLGSQGISVKKGFGVEISDSNIITTIEKGKIGELESLNKEASISLDGEDNNTSFTPNLITFNSFGYIQQGEDEGENSSDTDGEDSSDDSSSSGGGIEGGDESTSKKQKDYNAELTAKNFTLKRFNSNGTLNSYIDFNGPNNAADFECTVSMATSPTITSDERLKDIDEIDSRYEDLFMELKPIRYQLKGKEFHRKHLGYSAQEVEKALAKTGISTEEFAGLVIAGEEEKYSLRYEEFGPLYAYMLQKALNKIDILENRIEELEAKLS